MSEDKKTLIKLLIESNTLVNKVIDSGGEVDEDMEKALDLKSGELMNKIDGYAVIIDKCKEEAEYLKLQGKMFTDTAKTVKSFGDNLKSRLKEIMRAEGKDEFKGVLYRFKLSRTKGSVQVDEDELPAHYMREKIVVEPDKDLIAQHLSDGIEVPGARIVESYSVRKYVNKKVN